MCCSQKTSCRFIYPVIYSIYVFQYLLYCENMYMMCLNLFPIRKIIPGKHWDKYEKFHTKWGENIVCLTTFNTLETIIPHLIQFYANSWKWQKFSFILNPVVSPCLRIEFGFKWTVNHIVLSLSRYNCIFNNFFKWNFMDTLYFFTRAYSWIMSLSNQILPLLSGNFQCLWFRNLNFL